MRRTPNNKWSLEEFRNFLEKYPLYVKLRMQFPLGFHEMLPRSLKSHCHICDGSRTFRDDGTAEQPEVIRDQKAAEEYSRIRSIAALGGPSTRGTGGGGSGLKATRPSGIYAIRFRCSDCLQAPLNCWVEVADGFVRKVGQFPPWRAKVSKEIAKALGDNTELYEKALRNMEEGYGIGACAYLRRLLEQYINPLLELVHEVKEYQGASDEELRGIKNAISAKDFTAKTRYASEIAPASILVEGYNPLKEIHERLSVGIHALDESTANEYAIVIREALEFIIPALRQQLKGRKAFAEKLKEIRKLKVK